MWVGRTKRVQTTPEKVPSNLNLPCVHVHVGLCGFLYAPVLLHYLSLNMYNFILPSSLRKTRKNKVVK